MRITNASVSIASVTILVLSLLIGAVKGQDCQAAANAGECNDAPDENCPHRGHIIKCAGKYLDSNKNGKLDRSELDDAIGKLPWYGRGIVKLLGSTDKMMAKCDVDKDDAISMDYDMIHNAETCLATCFKRRAFKKAFFPDCNL